MTDEFEWEEIAHEGLVNYKTHRMRVDGGYIYRYVHDKEAHVCFVPDLPQLQANTLNFNWCKERIEKLESDMNFWIKEVSAYKNMANKFDERIEQLANTPSDIIKDILFAIDKPVASVINEKVEPIQKRLDHLIEATRNDAISTCLSIKKLEEILPRYDELHKEWMNRIERLENIGRQPSPWAMDSSVCALQQRIEKLEEMTQEKYAHPDVITRIERLEKRMSSQEKYYRHQDIQDRATELERLAGEQACKHVWDTPLLLSHPPKRQCVKCHTTDALGYYMGHPAETLSFCDHGYPIKFHNCPFCKAEAPSCVKTT